jgi:hypothetical protein
MTRSGRIVVQVLFVLTTVAALSLGLASPSRAESRRVVIVTKHGERIEGLLRSASPDKLSVEVAGEPVELPVDGIRSITFEPSAGAASSTITDLTGVQESLRAFHAALEIGMLRSEYASRLQQVLPPIEDFLKTRKPYWYPDAQLALNAAMEAYKSPLASVYGWSSASNDWQKASAYLRYAEDVVHNDPPNHREEPKEKPLALGVDVEGRIGFGDAPGPQFLGAQTLSDAYRVEVARAGKLLITASGSPCSLYEELRDASGKDMSTTHAKGGWAATVRPGMYHVVVYCGDGGVGAYKLRTDLVP